MKSTIRVDFDAENQNQPVIKVRLDKQSDDVRDKLLQSFFQALGGDSSWLLVRFGNSESFNLGSASDISISPIKPDELKHLSTEALSRIEASSK